MTPADTSDHDAPKRLMMGEIASSLAVPFD
jgi:hypothetical protein